MNGVKLTEKSYGYLGALRMEMGPMIKDSEIIEAALDTMLQIFYEKDKIKDALNVQHMENLMASDHF